LQADIRRARDMHSAIDALRLAFLLLIVLFLKFLFSFMASGFSDPGVMVP